jgi:sirohydrochlorin ferrochelatase
MTKSVDGGRCARTRQRGAASRSLRQRSLAGFLVLLLWGAAGEILAATGAGADRGDGTPAVGFLLAAPDRGFQGNEEVRELFETFAAGRPAALLFLTDERSTETFREAWAALREHGPREVVVLPFFLSRAEQRFQILERLVTDAGSATPPASLESGSWAPAVRLGSPFGETYYATELLGDRLRTLHHAAGRRLLVAGWGASAADADALRSDLERIAENAAAGFGFAGIEAEVLPMDSSSKAIDADADVVVPFALASKLDGMMSFAASLERRLPAGAELLATDLTPDLLIGMWLEREARRAEPGSGERLGVVVLAHGADYHWNETMRRAIAPLGEKHLVEPVFSMADPNLVERGIRRLEARGAPAVVVVRVFGLADSFAAATERMLGLDLERGDPSGAIPSQAAAPRAEVAGAHGAHGAQKPGPRFRTGLPVTTVGGLEDHPLFARALLERARALSKEPAKETVILTAHGSGDEQTDRRWHTLLESLAASMREQGGGDFRAIVGGTWREDWPAQREAAVQSLRAMVENAARDDGRALVIPARTLGTGPERRWLEGLDFELGEGFAPHRFFVEWLEQQVAAGAERLAAESNPRATGEPR